MAPPPTSSSRPSPAKDRILKTAADLFYAEGLNSVGIDRIIAEANVAKMTLYNHFPSKDALIEAVLEQSERQVLAMFEEGIKKYAGRGRDRLDAFFQVLEDWFESSDYRGCRFINAAVELADSRHPASRFASQHKRRFHAWLQQLVEESAGKRKAAQFGPAVALLVEGAIVTSVLEGSPAAARIARDATRRLLAQKP